MPAWFEWPAEMRLQTLSLFNSIIRKEHKLVFYCKGQHGASASCSSVMLYDALLLSWTTGMPLKGAVMNLCCVCAWTVCMHALMSRRQIPCLQKDGKPQAGCSSSHHPSAKKCWTEILTSRSLCDKCRRFPDYRGSLLCQGWMSCKPLLISNSMSQGWC